MSRPWLDRIQLEPERARRLIEDTFPALAPVRLQPMQHGWDNTVYQVNERLIFRFPSREIGAVRLLREMEVLPLLQNLPLPVPSPKWVAPPSDSFPFPFAVYPFIEGKPACGLRLSRSQRVELARPLGRFLAELHGIDTGSIPDVIGTDDRARLVPEARATRSREAVFDLAQAGLLNHPDLLIEIMENDIARGWPAQPKTCLLHGDLYVRHLLMGEDARLTAIIDWGDIHLGDPALDLEIALHFLPPEARLDFEWAYGPVDAASWARARFRALHHAAVLAWFGNESGDADLRHEGLLGLAFIAEEVLL